jgi:hypothetical protein
MTFIPKNAKRTGKKFMEMELVTTEDIPDCHRCFVMVGHHIRTNEPGWYAFCKRMGKLESVGPQDSFNKVLKTLILTKGCDTCQYNLSENKDDYLTKIEDEIEKEAIELLGEEHVLYRLKGNVYSFLEYRDYLDLHFKNLFGIRLFTSVPDDTKAVVDMAMPCSNPKEFALKIQALTGLLDRINTTEVRKIIQNPKKDEINGSINILETIIKERAGSFSKQDISNIRSLFALRSKMYPAHSNSADIIKIIQNFGIASYPPDNWETSFQKILQLTTKNMEHLVKILESLE